MVAILKNIFGYIAIFIAIISYIPYLKKIYSGKFKPHVFSWIIWTLLTAIAFFAQLSDGGGIGSWATGISAIFSLLIVIASFKFNKNIGFITKTDWFSFFAGLLSIPLWIITDDPLWSVILVTVIDLLGFYPSFRKGYKKPQEDSTILFGLSGIKFALAIIALEHFSIVTVLYPLALVIADFLFVLMLIVRRKQLHV